MPPLPDRLFKEVGNFLTYESFDGSRYLRPKDVRQIPRETVAEADAKQRTVDNSGILRDVPRNTDAHRHRNVNTENERIPMGDSENDFLPPKAMRNKDCKKQDVPIPVAKKPQQFRAPAAQLVQASADSDDELPLSALIKKDCKIDVPVPVAKKLEQSRAPAALLMQASADSDDELPLSALIKKDCKKKDVPVPVAKKPQQSLVQASADSDDDLPLRALIKKDCKKKDVPVPIAKKPQQSRAADAKRMQASADSDDDLPLTALIKKDCRKKDVPIAKKPQQSRAAEALAIQEYSSRIITGKGGDVTLRTREQGLTFIRWGAPMKRTLEERRAYVIYFVKNGDHYLCIIGEKKLRKMDTKYPGTDTEMTDHGKTVWYAMNYIGAARIDKLFGFWLTLQKGKPTVDSIKYCANYFNSERYTSGTHIRRAAQAQRTRLMEVLESIKSLPFYRKYDSESEEEQA